MPSGQYIPLLEWPTQLQPRVEAQIECRSDMSPVVSMGWPFAFVQLSCLVKLQQVQVALGSS